MDYINCKQGDIERPIPIVDNPSAALSIDIMGNTVELTTSTAAAGPLPRFKMVKSGTTAYIREDFGYPTVAYLNVSLDSKGVWSILNPSDFGIMSGGEGASIDIRVCSTNQDVAYVDISLVFASAVTKVPIALELSGTLNGLTLDKVLLPSYEHDPDGEAAYRNQTLAAATASCTGTMQNLPTQTGELLFNAIY